LYQRRKTAVQKRQIGGYDGFTLKVIKDAEEVEQVWVRRIKRCSS